MDRGWGDDKVLQGVNIIILFERTLLHVTGTGVCLDSMYEVNDQ